MFVLPSSNSMDISSNTVTLPIQNALGETDVEQELPSLSGETILLQLLKFKTHLLDVVEELHIRRDAETRFEGQISKLVLEKQELQWEKESLETQLETVTKQHTSSMSEVKSQFQAKFRSSEEEKGRYQVAAELKDKEINHLKDELKSLQLLKYNLEKKCSELEQKLSLQSRTKDSHMKQLQEVEKRFSVLARQCAVVKQAHEKLEQSVDESMRINRTLTSATNKQEETIVSLKKELEEVHNKLIKAKMTSTGNSKCPSLTGREQLLLQQLHHKLNLETEMIKKLQDELDAERAEKQDVIWSLQQTQGLLLNQTQTVKRSEVELQSQREMVQALKQEHEVVREKSKAAENKVVQVMESLASSKTSWDKEKEHFLDRIKREQEGLQAVRGAYEDLYQQHTELTSHAESQTQQIKHLEMENRSKSIIAPTGLLLTSVEDFSQEEQNSCLEVPDCGIEQDLVSSNSNSLNDTVSTRVCGGEEISQQLSPDKQTEIISSVLMTGKDLSTNVSGSAATDSGKLDKINTNCDANEQDNHSSNGILKVKENGCLSVALCDLDCSLIVNVDIPVKENSDQTETDQAGVNDGEQEIDNREEVNTKLEIFGKDFHVEVDEEGASAGKTTRRTDRPEDNSERSVNNTEMINALESETHDRAEAKSQGELVKTSETQTPAQTTADKTIEKSQILQVNEPLANDPSVAVCDASNSSTSPAEEDAESCFVNNTFEDKGERYSICSDDPHAVSQERNCPVQAVQQSTPLIPTFQRTTEVEPMEEMSGESSDGVHFKTTSLQPNASLLSAPSHGIRETTERSTNQTETRDSSDFNAATRETNVTHTCEESQIVTKPTDSELSPEYPEGEHCLTADSEEGDPSPQRSVIPSDVDTQACGTEQTQPKSVVKSGECREEVRLDHLGKTEANTQDTLSKLSPANPHKVSGLKSLDEAEYKDVDDPVESSLSSCKNSFWASFNWCSAERKTLSSRTKPEASYLHQFIQESPASGQSSTESCEFSCHPLSTIPTFIKSKPNKAPLIIMRASDLLNSSSVSGAAASWRRTQQGACEGAEAGRERTAANVETSTSPLSTSSSRNSKRTWSSTPRSDSDSAPGTLLQSDWEPSCSQEREDQQSSFRAQISKIEHFLNTERLRLPKRPRTDD